MIRILAVDDEKPIVELLKLTLNRSGYQCIGAYDGYGIFGSIESYNGGNCRCKNSRFRGGNE